MADLALDIKKSIDAEIERYTTLLRNGKVPVEDYAKYVGIIRGLDTARERVDDCEKAQYRADDED